MYLQNTNYKLQCAVTLNNNSSILHCTLSWIAQICILLQSTFRFPYFARVLKLFVCLFVSMYFLFSLIPLIHSVTLAIWIRICVYVCICIFFFSFCLLFILYFLFLSRSFSFSFSFSPPVFVSEKMRLRAEDVMVLFVFSFPFLHLFRNVCSVHCA